MKKLWAQGSEKLGKTCPALFPLLPAPSFGNPPASQPAREPGGCSPGTEIPRAIRCVREAQGSVWVGDKVRMTVV